VFILLTDVLRCPRCGPEFGLVVLADRVEERRVVEGRLGCSNCREQFPVRGGVADLRTGPTEVPPTAEPTPPADRQEAAVRIAALLGLAQPGGTVLVAGPGALLAPDLAPLAAGTEFVALLPAPVGGAGEGVTRMAVGPRLPFADRSVRAMALSGGADDASLAEALRVVAPGGRVMVEGAGAETAAAFAAAGAEVLLEQDGVVLARVLPPGR
jgi:uncharacterized protein YbaR (Trm112 family)